MEGVKTWVRENVDKRMFITGVATALFLGGSVYLLNKSNVKLLKDAAGVIKGK